MPDQEHRNTAEETTREAAGATVYESTDACESAGTRAATQTNNYTSGRNLKEWPHDPEPGTFRDKFRQSRYNDGSRDQERDEPTRRERIKNAAYRKAPDRFKNASDLQVRLRTGFVYIVLTLAGIVLGGWGLVLMLAVTAGICAGEFYFMLRNDSKLPNEVLGIIGAVAFLPAAHLWGLAGCMMVSLLLLLALLVWYVFWMRARIADVGVSFFGAHYTGLLLSSFVLIDRAMEWPYSSLALCVIFASVWLNDGMAYLVGSKIGKHKLSPHISPNKSWEGFIAGIVTSMLVWCVFVFVPGVSISILQALVFGLICGLMSVLGDLAESRIKRNSGVKDSGTIMPGHGGLLDRTDSMFIAAAVAFVLLTFGGCIPFLF